jgi:glycosyltransferase involved in cell wall biosynthesis
LVVVMPVYDEEDVIVPVVSEWISVLTRLNIAFQVRLYNDGSRDRTSERVRRAFGADSGVVLFEKGNSGHGATILRGYREARDSEWLLQIDSDGEMPAPPFEQMWRRRTGADFLIGNRIGRKAPWSRKVVTWASRLIVWLLFGSRIRDVNSPYRLMRNSVFKELFRSIPKDTFAPNLIVTGFVSRNRLRVAEIDVPFESHRNRSRSIGMSRLFKALWETIRYRASGRMPVPPLTRA